jgi:hypothetical protein
MSHELKKKLILPSYILIFILLKKIKNFGKQQEIDERTKL